MRKLLKKKIQKHERTCGNCVNCEKDTPVGWVCEEYGFYFTGQPVGCNPPFDEACELWTDDPKKRNTFMKWV